MAGLASHAAKGDVVGRRCHDGKPLGGYREVCCRTGAVALRAVGAGRRCVGVDRCKLRDDREVFADVARTALCRRCHRDMVCGLGLGHEVHKIGVATGTIVSRRVGGIGHIELPGSRLGARLETPERDTGGNGVLRDPHPDRIGFVTTGAVSTHPGVNHRCSRCRGQEGAARCRLGGHPRHHVARHGSEVAVLALGGRGHMRQGTRRTHGRHGHNLVHPKKAGTGDVGAMAGLAIGPDAAVAELRPRKRHKTSGAGGQVTGITRQGGRVGNVVARHALGTNAIVARGARPARHVDRVVFKFQCRNKSGGVVAGTTSQIGGNVRSRFTLDIETVMAVLAPGGVCIDVVEKDTREA